MSPLRKKYGHAVDLARVAPNDLVSIEVADLEALLVHADEADRVASMCTACSECADPENAHHWIASSAFACKHCPATAAICDGCDEPIWPPRPPERALELCKECSSS